MLLNCSRHFWSCLQSKFNDVGNVIQEMQNSILLRTLHFLGLIIKIFYCTPFIITNNCFAYSTESISSPIHALLKHINTSIIKQNNYF